MGITSWCFKEIPESIEIETPGGSCGAAFPGLEAGADSVNLRLFTNAAEAREQHLRGVAQLLSIHFSKELKQACKSFFPAREKSRNRSGQQGFESAVLQRLKRILFEKPARTEKEFTDIREKAGPRIFPLMQEIIKETGPVLQAGRELLARFKELEKINAANSSARSYLAGLRAEFDLMVSEEFLVNYESTMLEHVVRHIKALQARAERGLHHLEKDRLKAQKLTDYLEKLGALRNTISFSTSVVKRRAIDELAWMIEEYKVSLFAPELKTAFPVSPKRLDEKISEIEMMV